MSKPRSIGTHLAAGSACLFFVAITALSQVAIRTSPRASPPEPQSTATAETERVIVTGSNIPTAAEVGPNPVQTIDRYTIDKSGERSAEDFIRSLPVTNFNGVPSSNSGEGFTPGASVISLRGFDTSDTLILIESSTSNNLARVLA